MMVKTRKFITSGLQSTGKTESNSNKKFNGTYGVLFSLLVLSGLLLSNSAEAFLLISGSFAKGARPVANAWVWTSRTVTFYVNTNQYAYPTGSIAPELTSAQFASAVQSAISAWADACNSDISVVYGGTTSSLDAPGDQTNVITWDNRTQANGNTFGASTSTLAAAASTAYGDNLRMYDCDIIVNGNFSGTFGVNGESNLYDLVSTLAHEVGHCLGLDHPVDPVGPPIYTSSNLVLYDATMVQTAVAGMGTTYRRTINQDDFDGIQCLYERGASLRSGSTCGSYHGTNNTGAIGGALPNAGNGNRTGPTVDLAQSVRCPTAETAATAVTALKGSSGSGCVTKAFADEKSGTKTKMSLWDSWMSSLLLIPLAYLLVLIARVFKRNRNGAVLGFFLLISTLALNPSAQAAKSFSSSSGGNYFVELSAEHRWIKPVLVNKFAELPLTKVSKREVFDRSNDAVLKVGLVKEGLFTFGVVLRYLISGTNTQEGTLSSGASVTKATTLSGFALGPLIRFEPVHQGPIRVFMDASGAMGRYSMKQVLTAGAESSISTAALGSELTASIGATYNVENYFNVGPVIGYSRHRSNFFTVGERSGSAYAGLNEGERIAVANGAQRDDLRLDRSGWFAALALSVHL